MNHRIYLHVKWPELRFYKFDHITLKKNSLFRVSGSATLRKGDNYAVTEIFNLVFMVFFAFAFKACWEKTKKDHF